MFSPTQLGLFGPLVKAVLPGSIPPSVKGVDDSWKPVGAASPALAMEFMHHAVSMIPAAESSNLELHVMIESSGRFASYYLPHGMRLHKPRFAIFGFHVCRQSDSL